MYKGIFGGLEAEPAQVIGGANPIRCAKLTFKDPTAKAGNIREFSYAPGVTEVSQHGFSNNLQAVSSMTDWPVKFDLMAQHEQGSDENFRRLSTEK
jgi:hypothetical protein